MVEVVSPPRCFGADGGEVGGDGGEGALVISEPVELGVVPVTFCFPTEHLLRQQTFAPQGQETLSIKLLRMKGPEAHGAVPDAG